MKTITTFGSEIIVGTGDNMPFLERKFNECVYGSMYKYSVKDITTIISWQKYTNYVLNNISYWCCGKLSSSNFFVMCWIEDGAKTFNVSPILDELICDKIGFNGLMPDVLKYCTPNMSILQQVHTNFVEWFYNGCDKKHPNIPPCIKDYYLKIFNHLKPELRYEHRLILEKIIRN